MMQRFARADKRAKLPKWINQYITESHSKLSTDMALALSRQFIRGISQPFDHSITGISVWTYEQVLAKQAAEAVSSFLPSPDFLVRRKSETYPTVRFSKRSSGKPSKPSSLLRRPIHPPAKPLPPDLPTGPTRTQGSSTPTWRTPRCDERTTLTWTRTRRRGWRRWISNRGGRVLFTSLVVPR